MASKTALQSASEQQKLTRRILDELAKLAGENSIGGDEVQEGPELIKSFRMSWQETGDFAYGKAEEEERILAFPAEFNYRPWDVQWAASQAMSRYFGAVLQGGSFWNPAALITIPSGPNGETVQVPDGEFQVPGLGGARISFGAKRDEEWGLIGVVQVSAPRKHRKAIKGFFVAINDELEANSLYRGRVFDGKEMPNFIEPNHDWSRVVYSAEVWRELSAQVLGPIRYTETYRSLGKSLKKAFLIRGEYGVGKSLLLDRALHEAQLHGWTGIKVRPGQDNIADAIRTGGIYGPSIVVVEDLDLIVGAGQVEADVISEMLELFDGTQAKGREVMLVMTSNFPERLPKGMLRPGRIDKEIEIGKLDADGIQRLIECNTSMKLAAEIDWEPVTEAYADYIPAFVVGAAEQAVSYAIDRTEGSTEFEITTEDLVDAGKGMRNQWASYTNASTEVAQHTIDKQVSEVVAEAIRTAVRPELLSAVNGNGH